MQVLRKQRNCGGEWKRHEQHRGDGNRWRRRRIRGVKLRFARSGCVLHKSGCCKNSPKYSCEEATCHPVRRRVGMIRLLVCGAVVCVICVCVCVCYVCVCVCVCVCASNKYTWRLSLSRPWVFHRRAKVLIFISPDLRI